MLQHIKFSKNQKKIFLGRISFQIPKAITLGLGLSTEKFSSKSVRRVLRYGCATELSRFGAKFKFLVGTFFGFQNAGKPHPTPFQRHHPFVSSCSKLRENLSGSFRSKTVEHPNQQNALKFNLKSIS